MAGAPEAEPTDMPAAEPSEAPTTEEHVVLQLEVEPGHTVTFYEPTPGGLYLIERRAMNQSFALRNGAVDALRAFQELRPGAPIPAALQAAYDRARAVSSDGIAAAAAHGGGAEAVAAPAPRPGVVEQSLTSSSSAANFVNNDDGCDWGPEWSACRVNWANGYYAWRSGATSGLCVVDHYAGNGVVIQVTAGSALTSFFQGAGTVAQYSLGTAGAAMTRRIDVTNASGDSFHVGCRWGI
ncbi:MAG TPA: hypothetical protein VNO30_42745 [Kofleriaceae bacterium]|nr:hypothetical protein [Kofleriaceae bacterium]